MSFNLDVKGFDKLERFASTLAESYKQDTLAYVTKAFAVCMQGIQRDCPVKTGRLRKSITMTIGNNQYGPGGNSSGRVQQGNRNGQIICRIDIGAPYAGFVEWGHRTRISKHPSGKKHHNGTGYVKPRYFVTPNVYRMLQLLSKTKRTIKV